MSARGGREAALAAVSLALLVVATFGRALSSAWVFYQRDIHAYFYPHAALLRRALAESLWPRWNPWEGFGSPLLADASFQLAYPPTWLTLPLAPVTQFKALTIFHCLLAALGALALARRLGLGWPAAGVAGGAYALSGPLLSGASLWHHFAGAAWLPWLLWALEGLLRRPGLGAALPLGLVAGAQLLAGSGDLCLAGALLGSARIAHHLVRDRPGGRGILALAAGGTLAGALAFLLGAAQWLPTLAQASEGHRAVLDARTNTYWSVHPASLADLAVPRLVAELPLADAGRSAVFEGREPFLSTLYLGVVPLGLGAVAIGLHGRRAAPVAAGFAFFVAAALGRHTPLYGLLLDLPGLGFMRFPQKFLWPAALCLAVLAALGTQFWSAGWPTAARRRARLVALVALGAAALALLAAWWVAGPADGLSGWLESLPAPEQGAVSRGAALKLARTALLALLLALLLWRRSAGERASRSSTAAVLALGALDLVVVGRGVNPLAPRELVDHRPPVLERLGGSATRVHSALEGRGCLAPGPGPAGWREAWTVALGFQDALRPPSNVRWGVRGSFDGEFTGLGSRWSAPFTRAAWALQGTAAGRRLLEIGGVSHVLRVGEGALTGLEPIESRPSPYACPLQVWRVPEPLPEAYVVHRARRVSGAEATLAVLLDAAFDPRREVVLEEAGSDPSTAPSASDEARVLRRGLDALEVEARLGTPGFLVVLEAFAPGWTATIDGAPARLLRANGLFRAVPLPEGRHRVHFSYRPRSATLGAVLSALGLAGALLLFVFLRRRGPALPAPLPGGSIGGGRPH